MKITKVEAIPLRIPDLDWTRADGIQDDVIVRVHTDAGITGIGEADAAPDVVKAIVDAPESWMRSRGLAGVLVGEDPLHTERLWDAMYHGTLWMGRGGVTIEAISAVDLALWDIKGKALGLPVHTLLGGARRDSIPVYASMLFETDLGLMRDRAQRHIAEGYRAVKFGWGPMGPDLATDVGLVRAAREAIGDAALLVDAGAPWTVREAIRRLDAFQEYQPFWLEEALASDDLAGWARLTTASRGTRIATGEQETLAGAFRDLLEVGRVDVIQPDLARAGGSRRAAGSPISRSPTTRCACRTPGSRASWSPRRCISRPPCRRSRSSNTRSRSRRCGGTSSAPPSASRTGWRRFRRRPASASS
jgi:L-rhamnonate dehydratase